MPNLVGIGNSQVPTNAMLGGLAYQNSVGEIDIEKVKARLSDRTGAGTLYKIFVYNTKNDSDGGAWRHRTQDTSWYNEGVSEIRGARKEFPSVAIIVVTNNEIVIYDGDDPNLSMWMVFPSFTAGYSLIGGNHDHDFRSVAALNGKMVSCNVPGGWNHGGIVQVDFIKDDAMATNHAGNKRWVVGIQKRGQFSNGYYQPLNDGSAYYLVDNSAQDVSMGLVSNSKIDPDTGLPVPTIGIISRGGNTGSSAVCVMRDDGKIFDIQATTAGYTEPREVKISGNYLYVLTDPRLIYRFALPWNSDTSGGTFSGAHGLEFLSNLQWYAEDVANDCHLAVSNAQEQNIAVGTPQQVIIVDPAESNSNPLGVSDHGRLTALIAKDYNTGWLTGDIRCSALNSTNSTSLTATNVTSNWATASNWQYQSQQITLASDGAGGINITHGSANGQYVYSYLQFAVDANSDYVIQVEFSAYNGSDLEVVPAPYNSSNEKINLHGVPGTSKGGQFNSGSDTTLYLMLNQNSTTTTTIKNITVQKVDNTERDRTYKRQSFLTVGTINRVPVNPGCELMYYQPNDSSSYLEAPMSTSSLGLDMNFSSAFYMNFWANESGKMAIEDFCTSGYNNMVLLMTMDASGVYLRSKAGGIGYANISVTNAGWNMFTAVSTGSAVKAYKNGHLIATYNASISNQDARVILFANSYNNNGGGKVTRSYSVATAAKMALARVGQTELTEAQMLKMYHDEKLLFTPNAKCSLYGSSSAVTAVAYDHENNHLHVGTSSGRSEFVGLKRINNTTTAVATAISVSDGLVAEK